MEKRRYGQYCGIAFALDVVGERWTLLIARDLVLGPKRFTDLLEGLPGIATNLLAQRLKEMEENGLVEKVTLPPPAGSTVYRLTERGEALEPAIMALGRWGAAVGGARPGDYLGPSSFFVSCRASFNPERARDMDLEFHVDGRTYEVLVDGARCVTRDGAAREPEAVIESDIHTLVALRRSQLSPDDALRSGKAKILAGDKRALRRFLDVFAWRNLPNAAPPAKATRRSAGRSATR